MASNIIEVTGQTQFTVDHYRSDEKPTWCPGCGDYGVLNALYSSLRAKGLAPHDAVVVSGIGCSSRLPFFVSTYGFHGLHGRTMPVATGLKAARPDTMVVVTGGDGDAFAIGGNHFIHAARRNVDLTYIVMDNSIYGLTKGQTSPTSQTGFTTKTTPGGSTDRAINPLLLALTSGATFVARGFSGQPKELTELIQAGMEHKGFAVIDVFSPCTTWNKLNTFKYYREETERLPASHDPSNFSEAARLSALSDPLYLGVFYREDVPTFEDGLESHRSGSAEGTTLLLESLFDRFS